MTLVDSRAARRIGMAAAFLLPAGHVAAGDQPKATDFVVHEMAIDGQRYNVVRQRDSNARLGSFNKSLASQGLAPVQSCKMLIDLPVGTADGNHSFGGVCRHAEGQPVQEVVVCDDDMVGHVAVEPAQGETVTVDTLARFVAKHCFGG